ncbi:MAG: exodeoxyribonuclease VII small subunit, partial [Clostridia bacterium]|nr:exodeoxyribonuclease VII small subunit [Clostridia bacterium]
KKLQEIVEKLERGDIELDESIELYEEGLKLSKELKKQLTDFEKKIAEGEMLEYAQYIGNYYGTPKKPVEEALAQGKNIILDIEVKGALQVKEKMPEAVMIYILPPDYETLLARIRGRGTETEEIIQKRMTEARTEIKTFPKYDYVVINRENGIDEAANDVLSILHAETMRTARNADIPNTFFN